MILRKFKNLFLLIAGSYSNWKHRNKIKDKSVNEVFSYIFKSNYWGDADSVSGAGSNNSQTAVVAAELPSLLRKYHVKNFLDIPCGDFHWMKDVDLAGIKYTGGDIVSEVVQRNQEKFGSDSRAFVNMNLITDDLPIADLLLCRDCFIHLSNEQVTDALKNIQRSGIRYLLTTSHTERNSNKNILAGEWRPVNLEIAPFNLKPVLRINEKCTEDDGRRADKALILVETAAMFK